MPQVARKQSNRTNSKPTQKRKKPMAGFNFDPNKSEAVTKVVMNRQECTTYESAMSYINDRLKEMEKSGDWEWIQELTGPDGKKGLKVVATLKTMPIYWKHEEAGPTVDVLNPDGSKRETRKVLVNHSRYPVGSMEEGQAMIRALASGEVDAMNERVRVAAEAYADVVNVELPAINEKAAMLWTEDGHADKHGAWGEGDEAGARGKKMSKAKTYAMNTCKQKARRQLGYARWAETIRVVKD